MAYESEIQGLLYTQLIADSTLQTALGGAVADRRVYLEWEESDKAKISSTKPGWIVIETLEEDAPTGEKQEVTMRARLHIYSAMDDRTTRDNVRAAISSIFQVGIGGNGAEKQFTTTSYLVWTKNGGKGAPSEDRGLMVWPYYLDIRYIPKS